MPDAHAILSPSASHRWLHCPASVLLIQDMGLRSERHTSAAAEEGTRAHELGEMTAAHYFGKISSGEFKVWHDDWQHRHGISDDEALEMRKHVVGYVELIKDRMNDHPYSQLELEESLPSGIDGCWGTSDAIIVSPTHIEVIDLKYGKGIAVSAVNNPQLRLYACGALDTYGDVLGETETVTMTIYQPRIGSGEPSSETITADELRAWREEVRPTAKEALTPGARFGPGEDTCRFCEVAGGCKPRMVEATRRDFGDPRLLDAEDFAAALAALPMIRSWCDAVQQTALDKAYSEGMKIPGYKVVLSGGRRAITDAPAAIQTLIDHGYEAEQVAQLNIKGLGVLDKLVGADELGKILGPLIVKGEGRPAVVPEGDPRPEVSPASAAVREFEEAS